jgi:hypothetical protein
MIPTRFLLLIVPCSPCVLTGCSTVPAPETQPATSRPADPSKPEHVLESFDTTKERQCIRIAKPNDLQASLMTRDGSADHFPIVTVKVYDVASDDVIVGYEPGCVVVHCGNFELHGPPVTFVQRREILRPRQPLEFEISSGDWEPSSTDNGPRDLLGPTELPPGRYPVWATFHLGGPDGPAIDTPRDWYLVP